MPVSLLHLGSKLFTLNIFGQASRYCVQIHYFWHVVAPSIIGNAKLMAKNTYTVALRLTTWCSIPQRVSSRKHRALCTPVGKATSKVVKLRERA